MTPNLRSRRPTTKTLRYTGYRFGVIFNFLIFFNFTHRLLSSPNFADFWGNVEIDTQYIVMSDLQSILQMYGRLENLKDAFWLCCV